MLTLQKIIFVSSLIVVLVALGLTQSPTWEFIGLALPGTEILIWRQIRQQHVQSVRLMSCGTFFVYLIVMGAWTAFLWLNSAFAEESLSFIPLVPWVLAVIFIIGLKISLLRRSAHQSLTA